MRGQRIGPQPSVTANGKSVAAGDGDLSLLVIGQAFTGDDRVFGSVETHGLSGQKKHPVVDVVDGLVGGRDFGGGCDAHIAGGVDAIDFVLAGPVGAIMGNQFIALDDDTTLGGFGVATREIELIGALPLDPFIGLDLNRTVTALGKPQRLRKSGNRN